MKTFSQNKIAAFWNWFLDNQKALHNLKNESIKSQQQTLFWLNQHLRYYNKNISYIIAFPKHPNTKATLVITAHGNPEYFKAVIDLIDNSPVLKNWKFEAFIQPTEGLEVFMDEEDQPFIFHDITLKASQAKFLPIAYNESEQKFDIIIYIKKYNIHCNTQNWKEALYIIMQHILEKNSCFNTSILYN